MISRAISEVPDPDLPARIAGRVDRLYADFTGIEVKEQDHLVDLYSPELNSAQAKMVARFSSFLARI